MKSMSRGWESKSVEEQQNQAAAPKPVAADNHAEAAERKRTRQALELQRERILSERTSSPHRRSALTIALADIEEKLTELGWSIHL
jgi:hypothetical protein